MQTVSVTPGRWQLDLSWHDAPSHARSSHAPELHICVPDCATGVTRAAGRRHRFTGPVTKRLDHNRPRSPLPRRPGSPISREIQTAGYVSKRGWDDSVQISGTPRQSTPRAVHLPVSTVKRIPMTPGAARLSAWRNAKVHAGHVAPQQAAAGSRLGLRTTAHPRQQCSGHA